MNPKNHPSRGRRCSAFFLSLGWFAQVIPLAAITYEADWKFESRQDDSSAWWQTLSVQTVPGVVYRLQKSSTLAAGEWETISTTYGMGEEWACPLFPGSAPILAPSGTSAPIHVGNTGAIKVTCLVLEKTTTGGTLISWSSLDDQTPRRMLLSSVTLAPIWQEFDSFYINHHADRAFAISPRVQVPVTFQGTSPSLGTEDSAMVAAFTAAFPDIEENITNSVANAALFEPQPENPGSKVFYRYAADWTVDSDTDGRYDWQEIILDGNNPYAADSDGNGISDQATTGTGSSGGSSGGSDEYPTPTDTQGPTPQAFVEQTRTRAHRSEDFRPNDPNYVPYISTNDGMNFENANSYSEFQSEVRKMSQGNFIPYGPLLAWPLAWPLEPMSAGNITTQPSRNTSIPEIDGAYSVHYTSERCQFRLHLDAPAPAGGYRIPLRLAKITQTYHPATNTQSVTNGEPIEIILECAEEQTIGTAVSFEMPSNIATNSTVTYIPAVIYANGIATAPNFDNTVKDSSDGVCLALQGTFRGDFYGEIGQLTDSKIYWRSRKLMGDGTFEEWKKMAPGPTADPYEGEQIFMTPEEAGVFQLQALLNLPNGDEVEFPYVRMRDARSIQDSSRPPQTNSLQKAGSPDFFGVTSNQISLDIRNKAVKWLGSKKYSFGVEIEVDFDNIFNPSMVNKDKCNLFVTHTARSVGATTPYWRRYLRPYAPIARDDWYGNPGEHVDLHVSGWQYGNSNTAIQPGRVIAGYGTGHTSGHVAILDYDGTWIGAGPNNVNKFINIQNMDAHYKPFTIRQR